MKTVKKNTTSPSFGYVGLKTWILKLKTQILKFIVHPVGYLSKTYI